jgi:type II secretory pathway pseudopilin PulG
MNTKIWEQESENFEAGFTIIDVITGMLIAGIFLLVSGQAMLLAAYSRVKAQETTEGILLIQQDLEEVKYKASATLTQTQINSMCAATTANNGFAKYLQGQIGTYPKTVSVSSTKTYSLTMTSTIQNTSPYNVLQLSYTVTPVNTSSSVATLYTEVIPDAAFQCN